MHSRKTCAIDNDTDYQNQLKVSTQFKKGNIATMAKKKKLKKKCCNKPAHKQCKKCPLACKSKN